MATKKEKEFCAGCGAELKKGKYCYLYKKEGKICKDCIAALQFKYPVQRESNPAYNPFLNTLGKDYNVAPDTAWANPIYNLTAQQVKEDIESLDIFREQFRASFGGAENVFEVKSVFRLPKLNPFRVGIPNSVRYKNSIAVSGYVRLGSFHKGDIVEIRRGNASQSTTVLLIRECACKDSFFSFRNPDINSFSFVKGGISEGYPAIMLFSSDAEGVEPGNLVVAD